METLLQTLKKTEAFLASKGVPEPRLDAEWLFAHGLGCGRLELFLQFERPLSPAELDRLRPLVRRRAQREPLQYILGETPWYGLNVQCDRRALIPRPETEALADLLIQRLGLAPPQRVLDLGTGTGALALALAQAFENAEVVAVDSSTEALELAAENARSNGLEGRLELCQSNWLEDVSGTFDLIVSNPPYLTEIEWHSAAPEVRDWEPRAALVAEDAGLGDLKHILEQAQACLSPGGWLALETGIDQHHRLEVLAKQLGYGSCESIRDLGRHPRYFLCQAQ
jgi:release factor glutamine methyltransferase